MSYTLIRRKVDTIGFAYIYYDFVTINKMLQEKFTAKYVFYRPEMRGWNGYFGSFRSLVITEPSLFSVSAFSSIPNLLQDHEIGALYDQS